MLGESCCSFDPSARLARKGEKNEDIKARPLLCVGKIDEKMQNLFFLFIRRMGSRCSHGRLAHIKHTISCRQ